MYITDPPLFADIGEIHMENYNMTFSLNGFSNYDDGILNFTIIEISFDMEPFIIHFDGISDMSDVVSRFLTFGGNIIRDRLQSLSHYDRALVKFNNMINTIIALIPDEIDLPGTNLYLEGGISKEL